MSKKKMSSKLVNLILMIASLALVAVSLIGFACPFVAVTVKESMMGSSTTENMNLGDWFQSINDMEDMDNISNWQIARVMLILAAVLLIVMAVLLILKCFIKHPVLKWTTIGTGMATVVCAVLFMVLAIAGCAALESTVVLITTSFAPHAGIFVFGIGAIASAIVAEVAVSRK